MQIEELNAQVARIKDLRDDEAKAALEKSAISKELEGAEKRMLEMLEEANLKSFKTPLGTVSMTTRQSVRLPQSDAERAALYEYLRSKDKYDLVVKPNSASLNSLWKEEFEEATTRGDVDYSMPGVEGVNITLNLSFRKAT
jgi:hypothetical protein